MTNVDKTEGLSKRHSCCGVFRQVLEQSSRRGGSKPPQGSGHGPQPAQNAGEMRLNSCNAGRFRVQRNFRDNFFEACGLMACVFVLGIHLRRTALASAYARS